MHTVGQCDTLAFRLLANSIAFKVLHGIPWKTDADDCILISDPDHLFKDLAGAARLDQTHIVQDHIQIKLKKLAKGAQLRIPII